MAYARGSATRATRPARVEFVGDAAQQHFDQRLAIIGQIVDPIARLPSPRAGAGARRRVETDAVGDPAVAVGIVGEHDRDPPLGHRRGAEARPGGRQLRGELHPVGDGAKPTMLLSVAGSKRLRVLNATARLSTRPSSSGRATFIARSRADRPRVPARQAASLPPASTTWSTDRARPAAWDAMHPGPRRRPVAFRTTDACARCRRSRTSGAPIGSLRLAVKIGNAFNRSLPRRLDQRDRWHLQVACLDQSAIEHQGRDRSVRLAQCLCTAWRSGCARPGQYRPARSSGAGSRQGSSLPSRRRRRRGTDPRCRDRRAPGTARAGGTPRRARLQPATPGRADRRPAAAS